MQQRIRLASWYPANYSYRPIYLEFNIMNLLFDFDGTLVDSFNCVMEKAILLAEEYNYRTIDFDKIETFREMSSKELIQFLKIPFYRIPKLIHIMRKHLRSEMHNLPPISDIYPVVEKLYNAKFSLGILTSNSVENVWMWLELHQMRRFFSFVHIESNYFSKKYLIKNTLKTYKLDKSETFYICDETRDIEAANKNDVKSVAVTWGYNSEKALLKYQPSFIAQNPEDILSIFGV